jgi:hypothetical protein
LKGCFHGVLRSVRFLITGLSRAQIPGPASNTYGYRHCPQY